MITSFVRFMSIAVSLLSLSSFFTNNVFEDKELSRLTNAVGGSSAPGFDTVRTNLGDYIWPTDASTRVTSSFAEYRSTHFHGGIDISTGGQKGYHVFAVRDGFVYRVKITANGYGKMLYLKHKDGYYSTYAHLMGFHDAINRVVRQEQNRRGTYAIDLMLDSLQLPVSRGDVIAYTGDTGFGPPHLHFEIRDENLDPINPLLCTNFSTRDDISPLIRRVMVSPLTYNSTVENSSSTRFFSRFPRSRRTVSIPQTLRVHGQIGFGVEAVDRSEGTGSKAGIHRLEFYLDDSLLYSMELNRVPAEETKQIDLHYDLATLLQGRGKFQKLFIDVGNVLPFYDHKPSGTGIINTDQLAEGKHQYRIVCMDIRGNRRELSGTLLANHKPTIEIIHVDNDEVTLSGHDLESVTKCYVYGKRAFQPNWTVHTLDRSRFEMDGTGIELPIDMKPYDVIKLVAETKFGSQSAPLFYFFKKPLGPARDVHIATDILKDYVRLTITTTGVFTSAPVLDVQEGVHHRQVMLEAVDVNRYEGALIPHNDLCESHVLSVSAEVNGKPATATEGLTLYTIPSNTSGSYSIDGGALRVSFDSGAVFRPLFMQISSDNSHRSPVYTLQPDDVLMNNGITLSMPASVSPDADHLGLYYRSTGGWLFQTGRADSDGKTFSTTLTRLLGEVGVLKDDERPTLGRLRVQARKGFAYASFRYYDNLSGVDPDEIKLYLDGEMVIPEIDGEHRQVWYQGDQKLARGKHSLRIVLRDRAKNEAEISRTFSAR